MTGRLPRRLLVGYAGACGLLAAAIVAGICLHLALESLPLVRSQGLAALAGERWSYRRELFGAAAMIAGSAAVTLVALAIAAPVGVASGIYLSEMCPRRGRTALKVLVELLAGIPSVVYGILGVLLLRPAMQPLLGALGAAAPSGDALLTGGLLLAAMVLPTVATLSDDALRQVPAAVREAARGLGLTRAESVCLVLLPQALPGILAAILLATGRALGETIALFLVVGRADNRVPHGLADLSLLLEPGQTITTKLGGSEVDLALGAPRLTGALAELALLLFLGVLALALAARLLERRFAPGPA